jgi:hypothetical protein
MESMIRSDWKCPKCKQKLYISNDADYWCSGCQTWHKPEQIDEMCRDWRRNQIVMEIAYERAGQAGLA